MTDNPFDSIPDVDFVPKSIDSLLREMTADYESAYCSLTGEQKHLEASTPERIFLYTEAMRFYTAYRLIDRGCKMNLLKYSAGAYLDNLAAMVGETRLPAQKAVTRLRFGLSAPIKSSVVIPRGTRASSSNKIYFETTTDLIVSPGDTEGICDAVACNSGAKTSGLLPGQVSLLVDPVAYVASVENIEPTQGGTDPETDDSLRLRVYLKPKSFSVAGPAEAYRYFVQAYSQAIEGISIAAPTPGTVDIRITLQGGELPTDSFIAGVLAYLDDKRPLTDLVTVAAPDVVDYELNYTYYIVKSNADKVSIILNNIRDASRAYQAWQSKKIGRDLTPDKLINLVVGAGAKRLVVQSPVYTKVSESAICHCRVEKISFGGIEDE